jgi:hypothetical protein
MTITISGSGNPLDVNGTNTGFYSTLMTAQATTSGTFKDFTGIPSWVKRITVMFNGVSTNGVSPLTIQLGDSGGFETTGYAGGAVNQSPTYTANTVGLNLMPTNIAAASVMGHALLTNIGGNTWVLSAGVQLSSTGFLGAGGSKTTSETLDRIRITTVNGTDTFDAGTINVLYE